MIPEAAVEALARLLAEEDLFADPTGDGWNANTDSSDHFMPGSRVRARVYLEAAAPHMLAECAAQAIEGALIDFGRESVYLTGAQETMAHFLRVRIAELRSK